MWCPLRIRSKAPYFSPPGNQRWQNCGVSQAVVSLQRMRKISLGEQTRRQGPAREGRSFLGRSEGNQHMTMQEGEHWICSSPRCRCEVLVVFTAGTKEGTNPKCSCGFPMRKAYSAPMIRLIADPEEVKNLQERFSSGVR